MAGPRREKGAACGVGLEGQLCLVLLFLMQGVSCVAHPSQYVKRRPPSWVGEGKPAHRSAFHLRAAEKGCGAL